MHTYFINTSPKVSCKQYEDVLFGSLIAKKQLIIPEEYISLDDINECSVKIARKVDEEADIGEETSLVIFFDVEQEKNDSLDVMRSYAAADELLLSMKAETSLVWKLCEMGKQPQKLIFVFAEKIPRGRRIQDELMNSRIWYDFGLPEWHAVQELVLGDTNAGEDDNDILAEQISQYLFNNVAEDRIIDCIKDVCWNDVIHSFSKHIAATGIKTEQWDEKQWYSNFRSTLDNYIQTKLRDSIQNKHAFNIEYWYQNWEEKDSKEKNRSECRLMLFLYAVVYDSMQQQELPLLIKSQTNKNQTPAEAFPVPKTDYQALGKALGEHYQYCSAGVYAEADVPRRIHKELEERESSERDFIKSIYNPEELHLIPDELERESFASGYRINLNKIIGILDKHENDKIKTLGKREKGLASQIRRTIKLIRKRCEENGHKIEEYIRRITNEYNRIKDEQLERMPFTADDCPDFTESGINQHLRMIDDLDNIEKNVDKLIADAEKDLLQPISGIPKPVNMDKEIKKAEEQTAYYLKCLKMKLIHLVFGVLFVLAVVVPYAIISPQVFASLPGYLFFGMTAALAVLALFIGYVFFYNQYHKEIQKVMDGLIYDFICSQQENKKCIRNFTDFLYKRIPRCYGLHHYRRMLLEYKEDSRMRRRKLTYHDTARERCQRRIIKLVDNLDLGEVPDKKPEEILTIDPDKDCADNEKIYILSPDEVRMTLIQGGAR